MIIKDRSFTILIMHSNKNTKILRVSHHIVELKFKAQSRCLLYCAECIEESEDKQVSAFILPKAPIVAKQHICMCIFMLICTHVKLHMILYDTGDFISLVLVRKNLKDKMRGNRSLTCS